jgi:fused signal recognition particle receptor
MVAGFFSKLKNGLRRTHDRITAPIARLVAGRKVDEDVLQELEETFLQADMGVSTSMELVDIIRDLYRAEKNVDMHRVIHKVEEDLLQVLDREQKALNTAQKPPTVILVVGVNGTGKTTSIGKIAHNLVSQGNKVIIGACDTFRGAAIEQLTVWAERSKAGIVKHKHGADAAAVAFDAIEAAIARGADYLIMDTAGRLHTKVNLMEEIRKIKRTVDKKIPGAPHETLLVLDATTGQNAVQQARIFNDALGLTGLVLTKLDGTAKGGIVISIQREFHVPVKFVGVGENIDDLQPFVPQDFIKALLE